LLGDREFVLEGGSFFRVRLVRKPVSTFRDARVSRPARGPRGLLTGCASAKSWWVQPFCRWSAAATMA